MQSIVVENDSNGNTRFVVKESQILATKIKDNGSTIEISFVNPKEVYVDLSQPLFDLRNELLDAKK